MGYVRIPVGLVVAVTAYLVGVISALGLRRLVGRLRRMGKGGQWQH